MSASWQLRAATVLAASYAVPGALACAAAGWVLQEDPGFLFAVLPFVASVLLVGGLSVIGAAAGLALALHRESQSARLRAAVAGGTGLGIGLLTTAVSPVVGTLLALHGGVLLWLMTTEAVARDLGPWVARPVAPWGSAPGRGPWAPLPDPSVPVAARPAWQPEAPQQGPWSVPPTQLPWLSWAGHSGPRTPWWVTWEAGLARGLLLWEWLLLGASLLAWVALLVVTFDRSFAWLPVMAVPFAGVVVVERRMRRRLERG